MSAHQKTVLVRLVGALVLTEIVAGLWFVQNAGSLYVYLTN